MKNISKSYGSGRRVLADFDFSVSSGDFVGILGKSGCGKSTLLRIIAGLESVDRRSGTSLSIDGRPITGPGPDRAVVFQSYSSFPWLTAVENVEFGLVARLPNKSARREVAAKYLRLVGLLEFANHFPRQLSGGQQQRIALARTLALQPKLMLLDEPFAALDAQSREEHQTLLRSIWEETKATILFVTHDIDEALLLARRVVVVGSQPARITLDVDLGEVSFSGLTDRNQVLAQPQLLAVAGMIRASLRGD